MSDWGATADPEQLTYAARGMHLARVHPPSDPAETRSARWCAATSCACASPAAAAAAAASPSTDAIRWPAAVKCRIDGCRGGAVAPADASRAGRDNANRPNAGETPRSG